MDDDDIEVEKDTIKLNRQRNTSSKNKGSNVVEEILDKIGIGKYQYYVYLVIGIAWLTDGTELMTISISNYVLRNVVWHKTEADIAKMGSTIFTGFFLGSLFCGVISDNYGRKNPLLIYMLMMFFTCLLSAMAPDFGYLIITRGMFGIAVGLMGPTSGSLLTEITPRKQRGSMYIWISGLFSIGEIFGILLAALLRVDEPGANTWRAFFAWSAFPALFGALIGLRYLRESPRFMLQKNKERGLEILKHMYFLNHNTGLNITERDSNQIDNWIENGKQTKENVQIKEILKTPTMRRITIPLWIAWWTLTFSYYGIVIELPVALASLKGQEGVKEEPGISYGQLLISVIAEIPGYFTALCVIEHPVLGRKKSLIISFAVSGIACIAAFSFPAWSFLPCILVSKLMINMAFSLIGPYTTELYPTTCRTTGFGVASAASRIGGVMMPWATYWSEGFSPTAPFLLFGIACVVAAMAVVVIPYDTVGRPLDQTDEE